MEFSPEDKCLVGEVLCISGKIIYEGNTYPELEVAFQDAIDSYLEFCANQGIEPQKSYKGVFNIRTTPELHKALFLKAYKLGMNLNQGANAAFESWVNPEVVQHEHTHNHHYLMLDKSFSPLSGVASNRPGFTKVEEFRNVRAC